MLGVKTEMKVISNEMVFYEKNFKVCHKQLFGASTVWG